jgi:hypothetical protein
VNRQTDGIGVCNFCKFLYSLENVVVFLIKVAHELVRRQFAHDAADNYLPLGLLAGVSATEWRGEEDDTDGRMQDLAIGAAVLRGSSQSFG